MHQKKLGKSEKYDKVLPQAAEFSTTGPIRPDENARSNIVIVCLKTGQVIPPHPEPYAPVVFVVSARRGRNHFGSR